MKRILISVIAVVLVLVSASCTLYSKGKVTGSPSETPIITGTPQPTATATPTPTSTPQPTVGAGAPNIIGIYVPDGSHEGLLTSYDQKWVRGVDINTFHAYATSEKVVTGSTRSIFLNYWNKFPNASQYKVGYFLSFTLKTSEVVNLTIKGPQDAPKDPTKYFYQYVEVYLYDAVHQLGRHSHLVPNDIKPDTMLTSIKLTAGSKIADVTSIRLTAFVYQYNDASFFDPSTGRYIGNVSYTIPITNGK